MAQRSGTAGPIPIQGNIEGWTSVQARAVPRPTFPGTDTGFVTVDSVSPAAIRPFNGKLTADQGWYDVEVKVFAGASVILDQTVQRVGVGEVFVLAGQSLLANTEPSFNTASNDDVSTYSLTTGWAHADDPQPNVTSSGGSVIPLLGDQLHTLLSIPIGFVDVAQGNTLVSDWVPGQPNYNLIKQAVKLFPINGFRTFLWEQGQNDNQAGTSQAAYTASLESIIDQLRLDAHWTVPCGIAKSTWLNGSVSATIQAAQVAVQGYTGCYASANDDSLDNSNRQGDQTHFTNAGGSAQAGLYKSALQTQYGW